VETATRTSESEEVMERRKLLQALTALPAMVIAGKDGKRVGMQYEIIKPDKKYKRYVVFVNATMVDIEDFCRETSLPPGTLIHPVYPSSDESMDDCIRIFEVS
jgi:hypothetical protein